MAACHSCRNIRMRALPLSAREVLGRLGRHREKIVTREVELRAIEREQAKDLDWTGTGRFAVHRCIGRGGMGAVYEARDGDRGQSVALKTLLHFDPAGLY